MIHLNFTADIFAVSDTMTRLKGALVGHSFTRRLSEYYSGKRGGLATPERTARKLNLDGLYRKIYIFGQDSYTVSGLRNNIYRAGDVRPACVVINCGSNDLCKMRCDMQALVNGLVAYAGYLHGCGVQHVTLLGVVKRKKCREVTPELFATRAHTFNGMLMAAVENLPGVEYGNMKGFWKDTNGNELAVDDWSDDGIHPSTRPEKRARGVEKYGRVIRRCLLAGVHHAHRS